MRKALFASFLGLTLLAGSAAADIRTGKTIIFNLAAFDPAPGPIDPLDAKKAFDAFAQDISTSGKRPLSDLTFQQTKVWKKVHGDGYIICSAVKHVGGNFVNMAISISTGPFPGMTYQNLWDEQAYNLVGCNTPGATTI